MDRNKLVSDTACQGCRHYGYSLSYLTPKQFREQFAPCHNC